MRLRFPARRLRLAPAAAFFLASSAPLARAEGGAPAAPPSPASKASAIHAQIDARTAAVLAKAVSWRRDLHQNPELGNREVRTARVIAEHLRGLGLEVKTEVAHTGVVGLLKGGRPGPVVALRSDMDALPVTEEVDLPFASKVKTQWAGREAGVMHACGHDMHMAILMATAEVLSGVRASLAGSVKFIFQPAEEGPPPGERGGAEMMVAEGVLENPKVDAVFGLHVFPQALGAIVYKPEGIMAASDTVKITVKGRQTHGAVPWAGVDPIVVAAQVVLGLQTIVSRQTDVTAAPAIVTLGVIQGGNRSNIIPDSVALEGTIRTFDPGMRAQILERVKRTAERIAESAGATAVVAFEAGYPVTYNDPRLTEWARASLQRAAPAGRFVPSGRVTATSEDFSRYQEKVPGVFFFLGVTADGRDPATVAANHSPRFEADEAALPVGVRALSYLAFDYLQSRPEARKETALAAEPGPWTTLFDGKDTTAWRSYAKHSFPAAGWRVEGDSLHVEAGAKPGDIVTRLPYGDFELELEWKVAAGANSGILYRAPELPGKPVYWNAFEYQILDDDKHADGKFENRRAGTLYDLYPAKGAAPRPVGEWSSARIVARGTKLEHWLNGALVVSCDLASSDYKTRLAASKFATWEGFGTHPRGYIALQDHGDDVWFRRIRVRELR